MNVHPSHDGCIVCRDRKQGGLGIRFAEHPEGGVVGCFDCDQAYRGYPDRLHGGIVSMLLDAAMTHCLFARGITGVTAKLEITFRHPVQIGIDAEVRAWIERTSASHFVIGARLDQDGRARVVAHGLFAVREFE